MKRKYRRYWYIQTILKLRKTDTAHRGTFWLCEYAKGDGDPVGFFIWTGLLCIEFCFMLGARDTRLGGTRMKHELEQVHIESYGLTGSEMVVAAAIKAFIVSLPQPDAKRVMNDVISLEKDAVSVDGKKLADLMDNAIEFSLEAVRQEGKLVPELRRIMESQLKSIDGAAAVQNIGTKLLDFLYDCWTFTEM